MDYYNQKRCIDGKGLVLPSQIVSSALQLFNFNYVENWRFWSYYLHFNFLLSYVLPSVFFRGMSNILNGS